MPDRQFRVHCPSHSRGILRIKIIDNNLAKHQPRCGVEHEEQERPIDSHGLWDDATLAAAFPVSVSVINKVHHLTRTRGSKKKEREDSRHNHNSSSSHFRSFFINLNKQIMRCFIDHQRTCTDGREVRGGREDGLQADLRE